MMGINAVKGVEIGAGFAVVNQRGSEHRDELTAEGFSVITPVVYWEESPAVSPSVSG